MLGEAKKRFLMENTLAYFHRSSNIILTSFKALAVNDTGLNRQKFMFQVITYFIKSLYDFLNTYKT